MYSDTEILDWIERQGGIVTTVLGEKTPYKSLRQAAIAYFDGVKEGHRLNKIHKRGNNT